MKKITFLRNLIVLVALLIGSGSAMGQGTEDFEAQTALTASYATSSFTNATSGITWSYANSRNEETYGITNKGIMLRYANSYLEATLPNGFGSFSFQYRKAFTGGSERQLELLVNGVQVAVSPTFGSVTGAEATIYDFTYNVNTTGPVTVKIKNVGSGTTNKQIVVDNIQWTASAGGSPTVSTPTFSPTAGNYLTTQNITISTSTESATIYYTTDGSDPDNTDTEYTTPIVVSATTTVKAIAYKTDMDPSAIASATYTFPTEVANIAALRAGTTGSTVYKLTGEAVMTFKSSNRNVKYIQDATGGILIDDNDGNITTAYNVNDGITGITGTLNLYNGMLQFIPVTDPGVATSTNNTVTPIEATLTNYANYPGQLVKITGLTIVETGSFAASTNYTLSDGTNSGVLRTQYSDLPYVGTAIPTVPQDITGVVLMFNSTAQLVPRTAADFSNTVIESPSIFVAEVEVPAMSAYVDASDSETITVNGVNLTENITLTLGGDNASQFRLSTSTLTQAGGSVTDASVTIYYEPKAAGSHTATVTLSSTGAGSVVKTLSGAATWAPLDAPVAVSAGAITQTGFTANWNAVAGATEYELSVYTKGAASTSTVLSETFNGFTKGTPDAGANSTDVSSSLDTYTQTSGWTGSKVYEAGGTAKMGGSSSLGYITTPAIDLSANSGSFTVEFDAMAWSGDATEFKIFLDDVLIYTVTGLNNSTYTLSSFSINLTGGTSTSKLRFEGKQASKARFFLDNLVVKQASQLTTPISGSPFTVTDGTSKAITGLTPSTTYYYTVKAKNTNVTSEASNEVSVVTSIGTSTDNPSLTSIYAHNANIHFTATAGEKVEVYNAVGQKIISTLATDGQNELPVNAKGVMIVKVGSRLAKVIL